MATPIAGLGVCDDGTFASWTAPTFSAGDYTASGSMTWTVDASDAAVFYMILGKTMFVSFRISATSVGGTLSNELYIKIPDGKTAKRVMTTPVWIAQAGPLFEARYSQVAASATNISLRRLTENNWVSSTNNTYIFGQIVFEIQ